LLVTQAEVSNLDIHLNFSGLRDAEEATCDEKEPANKPATRKGTPLVAQDKVIQVATSWQGEPELRASK